MKVAIVHPWFLERGGDEKVVEALAAMYPDADIFTLSVDLAILSTNLRGRKIFTSGLNNLLASRLRGKREAFIPLFPWATEGLDVRKYDLIFSSCGPAAMGVNVSPDAVHISYFHTPARSWWDQYAERQAGMNGIKKQIFILFAVFIRMWEFNAMQRVDHVVSNSSYIAHRVFKYFRRHSTVIYPPVNTSMGYLTDQHEDYYLSVSRLEFGKRIDLLIYACNQLKRRLVIGGVGREEKQLKAIAGPTIEFLGWVPDEKLPALYANCRALLFAADEDFGIVPLEAQAFGRPVIAYGHGGSLETVRTNDPEGRSDTGIFFPKQTIESVIDGIQRFESEESNFNPAEIQQHARQFDTLVFVESMRQFVNDAMRRQ